MHWSRDDETPLSPSSLSPPSPLLLTLLCSFVCLCVCLLLLSRGRSRSAPGVISRTLTRLCPFHILLLIHTFVLPFFQSSISFRCVDCRSYSDFVGDSRTIACEVNFRLFVGISVLIFFKFQVKIFFVFSFFSFLARVELRMLGVELIFALEPSFCFSFGLLGCEEGNFLLGFCLWGF